MQHGMIFIIVLRNPNKEWKKFRKKKCLNNFFQFLFEKKIEDKRWFSNLVVKLRAATLNLNVLCPHANFDVEMRRKKNILQSLDHNTNSRQY